MSIRFLHTSDWQLGMTRAFLSADAQARYADDQIEAVRQLARTAAERECAFAVVAGDVFDSLLPSRRVVTRALDALATFTVPVFLLPGNHDADNPAGLWAPGRMPVPLPLAARVLHDATPVQVPDLPVEVVGAPWPSRKPDMDLLEAALTPLDPAPPGTMRVAVGHGAVDSLAPDPLNASLISVAGLRAAITSRRVSYVALGDRHSATEVSDRIWYSGAPVATDFDEIDSNRALVVDLDPDGVAVEPVAIGRWHFVRRQFDLVGAESVRGLADSLASLPEKERTVVRLALVGTVDLATAELLDQTLAEGRDLLASLEVSEGRSELVVIPAGSDLASIDLSGFASEAVAELSRTAASKDEGAEAARDALMLVRRLAARAR
ncbi:MAG: exonuclease SbcCD subunit D [Candidatus Dormibacteraeota bacterium]|nr:exonuclease SbcCD subunit D [Candidatus Dormibacteraeota bacterium]